MATPEAARGWGESGSLPSEAREISAEPMSESRPHRKNQLCGGQRKSTLNGGTRRCKGGGGGRPCSPGSRPDVTRSDGKGAADLFPNHHADRHTSTFLHPRLLNQEQTQKRPQQTFTK